MQLAAVFRKGLAAGLWAVILVVWSASGVFALDTFFVGPRAQAMGGANVASVDNTTAQYYNPAAFGFFGCRTETGERIACDNNNIGRKYWGLDINAGLGIRMHDEFGAFLDDLADVNHLLLSGTGVVTESDLANLVELAHDLAGLDDPDNAFTADGNGGVGLRIGHFGIGVRAFAQATGRVVNLDKSNLGLSTNLAADLTPITPTGWVNDGTPSFFSAAEYANLVGVLGAANADKVDFIAAQADLDPALSADMADLLTIVQSQSGTGTLAQNTTTVLLRGFGHAELPLTYGAPLSDHWAIGGNVKLMVGRVYGTEVLVFDNDSGNVLREVDENFEESWNVGVDLGLMGRYKFVNFGVVGRNLNAPTFDGPTVTTALPDGTVRTTKFDDVRIDPQAVAGLALIPHPTLVLEADIDLTRNETTFPGYRTQNLMLGLEWDAFRFLALRGGAYRNLLEDDIDWVLTGGLGLNFWAARLDVAGAIATEKEQFDGHDIPKESRVAAQLSIDF